MTSSLKHNSTIVPVDLGERSYNIVIGPGGLADAAKHISAHLSRPKVFIVTDETVAKLHLKTLTSSLKAAGISHDVLILPPGEGTKSFEYLQSVTSALLDHDMERGDTVIAFGGGVIGDLVGFAASMLKRGCRFIQIPTTLLAQVDSSVGGKTAINMPHGKNLIGAFYQPRLVLADTATLCTLPERQLKAGYAEVVKYGLLGDRKFFDWLDTNGKAILSQEPRALAYAIAESCKAKARIVAADEFERGQRALLNLGHTFGHALEAEAGFSGELLHGEAVSAGMEMAFSYAARRGLCSGDDAAKVRKHFESLDLMTIQSLPKALLKNPDRLLAHMMHDKKNSGGALTLILPRSIGETYVEKNASQDDVLGYLKEVCA